MLFIVLLVNSLLINAESDGVKSKKAKAQVSDAYVVQVPYQQQATSYNSNSRQTVQLENDDKAGSYSPSEQHQMSPYQNYPNSNLGYQNNQDKLSDVDATYVTAQSMDVQTGRFYNNVQSSGDTGSLQSNQNQDQRGNEYSSRTQVQKSETRYESTENTKSKEKQTQFSSTITDINSDLQQKGLKSAKKIPLVLITIQHKQDSDSYDNEDDDIGDDDEQSSYSQQAAEATSKQNQATENSFSSATRSKASDYSSQDNPTGTHQEWKPLELADSNIAHQQSVGLNSAISSTNSLYNNPQTSVSSHSDDRYTVQSSQSRIRNRNQEDLYSRPTSSQTSNTANTDRRRVPIYQPATAFAGKIGSGSKTTQSNGRTNDVQVQMNRNYQQAYTDVERKSVSNSLQGHVTQNNNRNSVTSKAKQGSSNQISVTHGEAAILPQNINSYGDHQSYEQLRSNQNVAPIQSNKQQQSVFSFGPQRERVDFVQQNTNKANSQYPTVKSQTSSVVSGHSNVFTNSPKSNTAFIKTLQNPTQGNQEGKTNFDYTQNTRVPQSYSQPDYSQNQERAGKELRTSYLQKQTSLLLENSGQSNSGTVNNEHGIRTNNYPNKKLSSGSSDGEIATPVSQTIYGSNHWQASPNQAQNYGRNQERYGNQQGQSYVNNPKQNFNINQGQDYKNNQEQMYNNNQQQVHNSNKDQSYNSNQGQSYNSDQGQSYNSDQGQSYNSNQGQSYNSNQGQNYNSNQGQNYNSNQGQNYNSNQGQNYNVNQGQNYNNNQRQKYNTDQRQNHNADQRQNYNTDQRQNYNNNDQEQIYNNNQGQNHKNDQGQNHKNDQEQIYNNNQGQTYKNDQEQSYNNQGRSNHNNQNQNNNNNQGQNYNNNQRQNYRSNQDIKFGSHQGQGINNNQGLSSPSIQSQNFLRNQGHSHGNDQKQNSQDHQTPQAYGGSSNRQQIVPYGPQSSSTSQSNFQSASHAFAPSNQQATTSEHIRQELNSNLPVVQSNIQNSLNSQNYRTQNHEGSNSLGNSMQTFNPNTPYNFNSHASSSGASGTTMSASSNSNNFGSSNANQFEKEKVTPEALLLVLVSSKKESSNDKIVFDDNVFGQESELVEFTSPTFSNSELFENLREFAEKVNFDSEENFDDHIKDDSISL